MQLLWPFVRSIEFLTDKKAAASTSLLLVERFLKSCHMHSSPWARRVSRAASANRIIAEHELCLKPSAMGSKATSSGALRDVHAIETNPPRNSRAQRLCALGTRRARILIPARCRHSLHIKGRKRINHP